MLTWSSHVMVCVHWFLCARGRMCSIPASRGGRDGRWYGNRVNFGRARDVRSCWPTWAAGGEESLQFSPYPFYLLFPLGWWWPRQIQHVVPLQRYTLYNVCLCLTFQCGLSFNLSLIQISNPDVLPLPSQKVRRLKAGKMNDPALEPALIFQGSFLSKAPC